MKVSFALAAMRATHGEAPYFVVVWSFGRCTSGIGISGCCRNTSASMLKMYLRAIYRSLDWYLHEWIITSSSMQCWNPLIDVCDERWPSRLVWYAINKHSNPRTESHIYLFFMTVIINTALDSSSSWMRWILELSSTWQMITLMPRQRCRPHPATNRSNHKRPRI